MTQASKLAMYFPATKIRGAEKRNGLRNEDGSKVAIAQLSLDDCVIDKTKHATIAQQRLYFQQLMKSMSRDEGEVEIRPAPPADRSVARGNEEDALSGSSAALDSARSAPRRGGWVFYGRTEVANFAPEDQLDVFARDVSWSNSKQLRSIVETDVEPDLVVSSLLPQGEVGCRNKGETHATSRRRMARSLSTCEMAREYVGI